MIYKKKNCFASFEFIIHYRLWVRNFFDLALTSLPRRRFYKHLLNREQHFFFPLFYSRSTYLSDLPTVLK